MILKVLSMVINKVIYIFTTPLWYAKFIGVNIGVDNRIRKCHWSSEPYLITVGSHNGLTNCKIFTHGGGRSVRHIDPSFDVFGKVKIGDYNYIGTDSLIMPGVTIGNHNLIAAGSVITKSIPNGKVVAGNPAKIICSIEEYYERNKKFNAGTKNLSRREKIKALKKLPDEMFLRKSMMREQ